MKSFLRLLIFLMAFQMEVRVKAAAPLQVPTGCLKATGSCAVKAVQTPLYLKQKDLLLHASPGTVLEKQSLGQWRFVRGKLWVEEGRALHVSTLYADIESTRGEFWILSQGDRIWIRNMSADLRVTLRDGRRLQPPEGFQFWISGINSDLHSNYGMIEPIDMKEHLPLWWSLFCGSKKQFRERVAHFRENWGDLAERSSEIYKEQALRKIASVQESRKAAEERQQRAVRERERIRELFRARTFDR